MGVTIFERISDRLGEFVLAILIRYNPKHQWESSGGFLLCAGFVILMIASAFFNHGRRSFGIEIHLNKQMVEILTGDDLGIEIRTYPEQSRYTI